MGIPAIGYRQGRLQQLVEVKERRERRELATISMLAYDIGFYACGPAEERTKTEKRDSMLRAKYYRMSEEPVESYTGERKQKRE